MLLERVETAVIPAAGYGSRMNPLTLAIPKEMFPLGSLPIIEHTLMELVTSGIKRIGIVIREDKEIIKRYLNKRKEIYKNIELRFVYQKGPLGLGDAIQRAKDFIEAAPFIMAIPDQILLSEKPATQQLLEVSHNTEGIWNSLVEIPETEIDLFKGSRPFKYQTVDENVLRIEDFSTNEASRIRGFGRTIFLPETLEYMTEEYASDATGEVDLLKTFYAIKKKFILYGTVLKGIPCDLGTWEGYYYYLPTILRFMRREEGL